MQHIYPEILAHLDAVIEHLWTPENRVSFVNCDDPDELAGHIMGPVMALDRWLADQKRRQQNGTRPKTS